MPDWIVSAALVIAALVLAAKSVPYWLGPLLIKTTTTVLARPEVARVADDALPDPVKAYFNQTCGLLIKQGCQRLATVAVRTAPKGTVSYAVLVLQPETRVLGMVAALAKPKQQWLTYVEFSSEFADGSAVTTNNSPIVSPYKQPETSDTLQFAWIEAPGKLYKLHLARLAADRKGKATLPHPGQELDFIETAIERPVRAQADFGYFKLDQRSGVYRLTWPGAFRMTWLSLAPFNRMREKQMHERATACLAVVKANRSATQLA